MSNSLEVSKLLYVPRMDEQDAGRVMGSSANGIFVGMSRVYGMPFFLNPDALMNPHVFITGITGSGKTYLTKNLMLKLYAVLGCVVIVIDFTGEYAEFATLFSAEDSDADNIPRLIDQDRNMIVYLNLKGIPEGKKVSGAITILKRITEKMRERGHAEKNRRIFVILDEAWKLIERSKPLETIIREGRKYRVGIVIASQIIGDLDAPFLSNMATLFVFRVQDKVSLEVLQRNYNLRDDQIAMMQNLELGSCMIIQINKFNVREAFCLSRVIGIEAAAPLRLLIGEKMHVELSLSKFEAMVKRICGNDRARELISRSRESGFLKLELLIRELVVNGGDRRVILSELKRIGIKEGDLADAFAIAVEVKLDERD